MLIKKPADIKSSEITSESVYFNRRNFIRGAVLAATTTATGLLYRKLNRPGAGKIETGDAAKPKEAAGYVTTEGEKANQFEDITNYNNFYEFSTSKQGVAVKAQDFITRPWTIEVVGLVQKPKTFDLD